MKKILSWVLFLALLPSLALAVEGKVVGVSDGDTVTILTAEKQQIKVRLYGVDCPESHQDYGQRAKQFTSSMVFGKTVELETVDQDKYGRTVGIIKADGKILNEELLKAGFAWQYGQYCKRAECAKWKQLEDTAKNSKSGLWAGKDPMPPWEFRHGGKGKVSRSENIIQDNQKDNQSTAPSGGYTGNTKSRVFHDPGCRYFDCKNCSAHFKTREEAIKAGYRPCGICRP